MPNISHDELSRIVHDAVVSAINSQSIRCSCGLSAEQQQEMPHLLGMTKDIGDGDYSRGVETMRSHHKFIAGMMRLSQKLSFAIVTFVLLSIVGGIGTLITIGLKAVVFMKGVK